MRNKLLTALLLCTTLSTNGQTLQEFIDAARAHSPLLKDYQNQAAILRSGRATLRATLMRSRLELTGDYLFVPVVSKDGGGTSFKWNAYDGTGYYGYDLGESSGHLHAGLTWTQPLLGRSRYRAASEESRLATERLDALGKMERHQLERSVTEHYLLCLADEAEITYTDSVRTLLTQQRDIVERLAHSAIARQSDLRLLDIELQANAQQQAAARQSLYSHLTDLRIVCGLRDTTSLALHAVALQTTLVVPEASQFSAPYRLDSLSALAALRTYKQQYRPQLNLFVTGGLQTGSFASWQKHFGWSAGLTFSWTLYDGHALRHRAAQTERQLATITAYRNDAERQRRLRLVQCLSEIEHYDEQIATAEQQLTDYDTVLHDYAREIRAANRSVLDYITVLKSRLQAHRSLVALQTNRQLAIAAYNYWNW